MADFADLVWDLLGDLVEGGHVRMFTVPLGYADSPIRVLGLDVPAGGPLGLEEHVRLVGEHQILAFITNMGEVDRVILAE